MANVRLSKVVSTLPAPPYAPSCLYLVRTGVGFDFYLSSSDGLIAHALNHLDAGAVATIARAGIGTININPTFVIGDADYTQYVNGGSLKVVTDVVDNTAGSLKITGGVVTLLGDNFIAVDLTKQYRASVSLKSKVSGSGVDPAKAYSMYTYLGVVCYDSDKNTIMPQHVTLTAGSRTTLAAPLNDGDTNITIVDGSGWYNGTLAHKHVVLIHPLQSDGSYAYVGDNGRQYDEFGYSRHMKYYGYEANGVTDNGDGTWNIALASAWYAGSFDTGDSIQNSYGGGTYNYWITSLSTSSNTNQWHRYSSPWTTPDLVDISNPAGLFRNGTAFCKLMLLPNYLLFEDGASLGHNPPNILRETWYATLALQWKY